MTHQPEHGAAQDEAGARELRAKRGFVLGILQSFTPPAWLSIDDRLHGGDWWNAEYYVQVAQRLEAAKLDFIFFHDTLAVSRRKDGSMAPALKWAATAPAHDPMVLLPILAYQTKHIGLIGTVSTTYSNPFPLARAFGTLDGIGGGRIGWNIVTSFESAAAENFGFEKLPGRDDRYERAEEFLDVAAKLWRAWEPDAIVADLETDTYVDASKVHDVDHVGRYYKSRGPLNIMRSPQGAPYLVQAGSSPQGRDFAARRAEMVFTIATQSVEIAKEFRNDIRARAVAAGRNPDEIKVIYGCVINFVPEGWDPDEPLPVSPAQFGSQLEWLSASLDIDLSALPFDEPFPVDTPPPPTGIRGLFDIVVASARRGETLRETVNKFTKPGNPSAFNGTPNEVARQMIEFMEAVGGDGVMISREWDYNGEFMDKLADELIPALQKAGAIRSEYIAGATLRESMLDDRL